MKYIALVLSTISLGACSILDNDVQRGYAQNRYWNTASTFTTGDVRIVTQRSHPKLGNTVICMEPGPDVAKALSAAAGGSVSGGNGAVTGSLSAQGSSNEAVAELAGRSTALLGIRDGLFRACEAYANGAIGQGAYALVLSRYAQLLTTLFLGQDITGAAGAEGKAIANSAAALASASQPADSPPKVSTTPKGIKAASTAAAPGRQYGDVFTADYQGYPAASALRSADHENGRPRLILASDAVGVAPASPPGVGTPKATTPAKDASKPPSKTTSSSAASPGSSGQPAGLSTSSALALVRMNEDYIHEDILGPLLVACIDEFDPSRPAAIDNTTNPPTERTNSFLDRICGQLTVGIILTASSDSAKSARFVTPEAAAGWTSAGGGSNSSTSKKQKKGT